MILWDRTTLCGVKRWRNPLERTEDLTSKGENLQGKGKLKQRKEHQIREVVSHYLNSHKQDLHKDARNKHALSYLFRVVFMAA